MTFAQFNFDKNIFKAIEICGYTKPTPIQTQSIPEILNGKDLVASAQTGTGKTAAFVLPALQKLISSEKTSKPRVLILSPTRELAMQINDAVQKYGKFMQVKVAGLTGGMSYRQQLKKLSGFLDIVVATPGRLMDHMENRRVDLSGIEMLVLDEADRMLDMGFIDDVNYIANKTPNSRQTLLFSATVDDRLNKVISKLLKTPTRIALSSEKMAPIQISQELYLANNEQHKKQLLNHILENENIFKCIIFTATKIAADKLAAELSENYSAEALHGDLKQNRRNKIVEDFRKGKIQFVVATDVAARGIDVQDVTHVINFDLPKFSEDYVHRIGRTGRAGKSGIAISFATRNCGRHLQKIERFIKQKLAVKTITGLEPKNNFSSNSDRDSSSKKRGGFKPNFSKDKKFKPRFNDNYSRSDSSDFRKKDRFSKSDSSGFKSKDRFSKRDSSGFKSKDRFSKDDSGFRSKDRFSKDDSGFRSKDRFSKDDFGFRSKDRFSKKDSSGYKSKDRFSKDDSGFKSRDRFSKDDSGFKSKDKFSKRDSSGFKSKDRFSKDDSGFKKKAKFAKDGSSSSDFKKKDRFSKNDSSGYKQKESSFKSKKPFKKKFKNKRFD